MTGSENVSYNLFCNKILCILNKKQICFFCKLQEIKKNIDIFLTRHYVL